MSFNFFSIFAPEKLKLTKKSKMPKSNISIKRPDIPENLGSYKTSIDAASNENINIALDNNNQEHAEYALAKIFENAKGNLYIFADCLKKDTLRSVVYLRNLHGFISRSKKNKIHIILENNDFHSESLTFLKAIRSNKKYEKRVSIKILNKDVEIKKAKTTGEPFHFTTAPESGCYRLEYDTKERKAILNFNDIQYSRKLSKLFEEYTKNSSELKCSDTPMPKDIADIINDPHIKLIAA